MALEEERLTSQKLRVEVASVGDFIKQINQIELISGRWLRTVETQSDKEEETIEISGNQVSVINGLNSTPKYTIHYFYYNSKANEIRFCLFHNQTQNKFMGFFRFNDLRLLPNSMEGREFTTGLEGRVSYKRYTGVLNGELQS